MFSYYGSKSKIVDCYPKPKHGKIIEPFVGSARYSLKYFEREITLVEKFDKVYRIWKYLQSASVGDILGLPNIEVNQSVNDFKLTDEERWLIGYHLRRGCARPSLSSGDRCSLSDDKKRIANDLHKIKHWTIIHGDFFEQEIVEDATYFIDPPYTVQKHRYNHWKIDYNKLKQKIETIKSQVIVCGNSDDKWLPFVPLIKMEGNLKSHQEMIWSNQQTAYDNEQQNLFAMST